MSMPPSGVDGLMDEQALIEAEIQLELENIDLNDDVQLNDDLYGDDRVQADLDEEEVVVENELDNYIKRLQDQSNRFEQELLECDELLTHSSDRNESLNSALIPYEDHNLLIQLAKEQGCDVEQYKRKILEDIENDEVIIDDELADLIGDTAEVLDRDGEQCSISDAGLPVKIEKAIEEGVDYEEVPVSQELVLVNGERHPNTHTDIQNMLREQLDRLEHRYTEKMERIKKDEAYKRDEEEVRERRIKEERQLKLEEIQRQEQQLIVEQEMAEKEIRKEQEEAEKEMQEEMRKFQEEMAQLQSEMERQKKEHDMAVEMERKRQEEKQEKAVLTIQRTYRGYRVRKESQPIMTDRREIRKKEKEEQRIKEVEIEIERRKEEQHEKEEQERQRQEEEKRQKEEVKRQKEEEKKRLEEEKRRKKEEEERIKQEEKKRKEEEKQKKKEEEKRRKEEEKRRKEEEEQRKKEEKRLKEEEEKKRKEEEKRQKEEEKRRKEEEKKIKEEEKKREKERQLEEERKKKEEELKSEEEMKNEVHSENNEQQLKENDKDYKNLNNTVTADNEKKSKDIKDENIPCDVSENVAENSSKKDLENSVKEDSKSEALNSGKVVTESANIKTETVTKSSEGNNETVNNNSDSNRASKRPKTPRSARTPRTPRPPTPRKDKKELKNKEEAVEKKEVKADILPDHLEALRLKFMKECMPWSKVSNEPWKLKAGVSRKPMRRPSSAKKMPLLSEDVIVQAARVASLKMVTTVELKDLPGNNISTLGQCGGLRYLTLNNCNLVAIEGLSQCKQLQYINVQNNKIEYVDLKDVGQLQYLNLSHNKLSSIHGVDNCTNIRWLDLSYNNITRLGGMDTMRRLHTLKLSHNQLISTQGLGTTPTLQMIDVSHNHLQAIEDLDKLCLLFSLNASSNNLLQIPSLHNQVLLLELLLSDNSISSLGVLAAVWLPLLSMVQLEQNSISELPSLQNCFLLKELNLSENQITDPGTIQHCVEACFYMEQLHLLDNPVVADLDDSFFAKLKFSCPRINSSLDINGDSTVKLTSVKPRNSFETMCLTQLRAMKDVINQFEHSLKLKENSPTDQSQFCDIHYKFCDRTFNIAVEYRYAHEYGDISVAMPTAPTAPKSGRPVSARQREKFMNPKEMFENALKSSNTDSKSVNVEFDKNAANGNSKDLFENALKSQNSGKETVESEKIAKEKVDTNDVYVGQKSYTANSRDLFERALMSADKPSQLTNGHTTTDRGLDVQHKISEQKKMCVAATRIQAVWRGYRCRTQLMEQFQREEMMDIDPTLLEKLNKSAVKIQASWRGYILRKKLLAALEYAQCDFGDDDEDEDAMDFGDEFDLDKFVDIDEDLLDTDWKPPATPDIPASYALLKKPPSGKPRVPPINTADLRPPSNPRRAWRNAESPLSDMGKIPRPPSSVASTELTMRSGVSRKEEKLAEEWGFKDTGTAHLMMQRAKKMKFNAERRKKISKLDPKQRLALFRKLEEVTHQPTHTVPQRKTLPRKEYFQARQDEIVRQEQEKRQEYHNKASRTFEWLHSQVGDHVTSDSVINQGLSEGPKYMPLTENNLPELLNNGKRIQLVSGPMSVELQSVESASTTGQKPRRFSAGSGSGTSKLPPIQSSTAPASAPHLKERMSFRNPKVNQSVGWGGGKKRGTPF